MLDFKILAATAKGNFGEQLDELVVRLRGLMLNSGYAEHQLLFTRVYLSDIVNQEPLLKQHGLYSLIETGAVSIIEQSPLDITKLALQMVFATSDEVSTEQIPHGLKAKCEGLTFIFQSLRTEEGNAYQQTTNLLEQHAQLLQSEGGSLLENCMRTWFYVRDIDADYGDFVRARNEVFEQEGLTEATHYIASTGIEGKSASSQSLVAADFFSVIGLKSNHITYMQALDFLNSARNYGVAFERGTALDLQDERFCFVSGTASIDKDGQILHEGEILTQAGRLFLNISKLLESVHATMADISYLIVYLRDVTDYEVVDRYMRFRFPTTNFLIVCGKVCRPGWLLEVECVAETAIAS